MQVYRRGIDWDNENGFEGDRRQSGLTKKYQTIEVGRHEIATNTGWYTEKNSWSNFTQLCRLNLGHKDIWTSIKS